MPTGDSRGSRSGSKAELQGGPADSLSAEPAPRTKWTLIGAVLVGLLLGASAMHTLDGRHAGNGQSVDLQVSLGPHAGDIRVIDGDPVVDVPLFIANQGTAPVVLRDILVEGPGASSVKVPDGPPRQTLPFTLEPGRALSTRIVIRSDCVVPLRPTPAVTLVVSDTAGHSQAVPANIPALPALWGQTLYPLSCPAG